MTDAPMTIIVRWDADGDSQAVHGLDADPVSIEARYRRADLPVRVLPLVWVQSHMTPWQDDWHTIPTGYTIRCADENGWKWQGWGVVGYCPHPTTAKAAAQADHDARIRAALEE